MDCRVNPGNDAVESVCVSVSKSGAHFVSDTELEEQSYFEK
jgi:hypothetical protein